jgi:hypothetical protein
MNFRAIATTAAVVAAIFVVPNAFGEKVDKPSKPDKATVDKPTVDKPAKPDKPTVDKPAKPDKPTVDKPAKPDKPKVDKPTKPDNPTKRDKPVKTNKSSDDKRPKPEKPNKMVVDKHAQTTEQRVNQIRESAAALNQAPNQAAIDAVRKRHEACKSDTKKCN